MEGRGTDGGWEGWGDGRTLDADADFRLALKRNRFHFIERVKQVEPSSFKDKTKEYPLF